MDNLFTLRYFITFISPSFTIDSKSAIFFDEKKNVGVISKDSKQKVYLMILEDHLYTVKTAGDQGLSLYWGTPQVISLGEDSKSPSTVESLLIFLSSHPGVVVLSTIFENHL